MPNNKAKGNAFERNCSRMLSLWWSNGKRDDCIWRSASSGALTTVGKGRYLAHTGDFAATDGDAELLFKHVIIEAKRGYNRYSVQDLLDVPVDSLRKNPVWQMYNKLATACYEQGKMGIIIWKRDRRIPLVFLRLSPHKGPDSGPVWPLHTCWGTFLGPDGTYVEIMPWEHFQSTVSADRLKSLLTPLVASSVSTLSTPS